MYDENEDRKREDKLILSEDSEIEQGENDNHDNPFIELRNLIDDKRIDVKTILTDKQIIINHKLNTICNVLKNNEDEHNKKAINLISNFSERFMILSINKDGLSRQQFIDALHKGDDKVREVKNARLEKAGLQI